MFKGPTEKEVNDARNVLRADYWADVRGYAAEVERMLIDKETTPEDVSEAIHLTCDSAQRVIYTNLAMETVAVADGNGYEECSEEYGMDETVTAEQAAFFVLYRDVSDLVYNGDVYKTILESEG